MDKILDFFEKSFNKKVIKKEDISKLNELLIQADLNEKNRNLLRQELFKLVRKSSDGLCNKMLVDWLEILSEILMTDRLSKKLNKVYFSPGESPLNAILEHLNKAKVEVDICIFTISDDRIASKILDIHKRGVNVRIITDNDKMYDAGSDIEWLKDRGIKIKVDNTRFHMHHKFAIIDNKFVITGSYNWTRSAERFNEENILISNIPDSIESYQKEFNRLWEEMVDL